MEDLLLNLKDLFKAGAHVLESLVDIIVQNFSIVALAAWIAFWLFAVNWVKLYEVMRAGGRVGVLLIGALAILVWGAIAPPPSGYHHIIGLTLSNYVGKTVFVVGLIIIMRLCAAVQLSGACGNWCRFEEEEPAEQLAHASHHGHGDNHGHGGH